MSRERSAKDRERQKQLAREMRESQAASAVPIQDRETQPVVFDVVRRSPNTKITNNDVERVLGKYDDMFTKGSGNRINMVADSDNYPSPPPQPSGPGPGSDRSSSSSKGQRSLPLPQSSHNGIERPGKGLLSSGKPSHPPSHNSHLKNSEVKGNLKGGPGPGPGGGGGGGRNSSGTSALHKANLQPLNMATANMHLDPDLQQIMSEMSIKNPVSAITKTPRHDANFPFPLTPLKDTPIKDSSLSRARRDAGELPQKLGNAAELSHHRQPKPPDGSNIDDDLRVSDDSEEDEVPERAMTDTRLSGAGRNGTPVGQMQSSMSSSSNSKPLISPISKSSGESSSTESSDSDSNNTSDSEITSPPPPSPQHEQDNAWKLDNFISQRKTNSPISQGPATIQKAENTRSLESSPAVKGKRERHSAKTGNSSSGHRGGPRSTELRGHQKSENNSHFSDSSGVDESHPRPTPRTTALQQSSKLKTRRLSGPQLSTDSEDEQEPISWKSRSSQSLNGQSNSVKSASKLLEKPAKNTVTPTSRESNRKNSKKNSDSKKDNQVCAKSESGKSKRASKSREYVPTDSDDSVIIDVLTITPVKTVQASPQMSPMTSVSDSSKNSAKRSNNARLGESQNSESFVNKSDDETQSHNMRSQNGFQKLDQTRDKGGVVNRTFNMLAKKDKLGRDKDPADRKAKNYCDTRKSNSGTKDRNDRNKNDRCRTVSETSPTNMRNQGRPSASPLVNNKHSESPIVSAEPKVPIPQIQYENGVAKLTCTIPLSFIDKVPKHSENGVSGLSKADIKQEIDAKDVLDNRTRGGKGKRKACDPNTKSCNEDKSKLMIITSIFKPKTEQDKVKKEIKTEPVDSDEETEKDDIRMSHRIKEEPVDDDAMVRPMSVKQRNVPASPMSSIASDSSTSRQHRKKKKKDKQADKSPLSLDRKRTHVNSENTPLENGNIPLLETSSFGGCEVRRSRRDSTSMESERSTRKREHERDSSLESTKSSSRSTTETTEKRTKKARLSKETNDTTDVPLSSPNVRSSSQQLPENNQHPWPHSSQKDYKNVPEESVRNQDTEFGEEQQPTTATQHSFSGKEKTQVNESIADSETAEYQSRPTSHDPSVTSTLYRPVSDQTETTPMGTTDSSASANLLESSGSMVPPVTHRQPVLVVPPGPVHSSLGPGRPASDQSSLHGSYANPHERHYGHFERLPEINRDYTCYLNKAKELKHIADGETDRSMQAMKYLEAALYFILSGMAMEKDHDTTAPLTMYKDTLHFIKWVSSVFRRENQEGNINLKLAVISLRCQSLLSFKIYMMRRNEHKENQRQLIRYFQHVAKSGGVDGHGNTTNGGSTSWAGQRATGSPSHLSQTPSPAGSVGSEGSQSSGYTTSTEGTRQKSGTAPVSHTPPHPQQPHGPSQTVPVPVKIYALFVKQNQLSGHLASAHDMWLEADHYVYKYGMEDFFIDLDRNAGPLTLHSSLDELMKYVMYGLDRLRG